MYCIIFRGSVASCWPSAYSESTFFSVWMHPDSCTFYTWHILHVHYIVQPNRLKHAARDKLAHRVGSVELTFTIYDIFTTPCIICNLEVSKEMRKKRTLSEKFARHWIFQMKFYTSFDIFLRSFGIKEIRTIFSEHLTTRISHYNLWRISSFYYHDHSRNSTPRFLRSPFILSDPLIFPISRVPFGSLNATRSCR